MGDLAAMLAAKKYVEPPPRITRLIKEEQDDLIAAFDLFSKDGKVPINSIPFFLRAMGVNATKYVVEDVIEQAYSIDARREEEEERLGILTLDQAWEILETILPEPASEEYILTLLDGLNTEHFTGWMYTEDVKAIFDARTSFPPEKKLSKRVWKGIYAIADPLKKNKFTFASLARKLGN